MARVEYRNVHKTFADGSRALTDFSLAVADGELMVLVGPSGCGKSTALRLLAGLDWPSDGEILIDGAALGQQPPQARNIAMVFQNYALYPHMTVWRNLAFPLRMLKLPRAEIERRVAAAAELLELQPLLARRPAELSGGQRQRVAMGRAIVREPRVFLMDEPLSNLDARLRVQIRAEIAALQRRLRVTMIYVTHDQVEAMTLGERVAVIHDGRLQQVAAPQQLYDRPANTFVARFIGNPGMNILPVRVQRHDGAPTLLLGTQRLPLPDALLARYPALASPAGQSLLLGLRPEDVSLAHDGGGPCLEARVEAIETLGHESLLHFRLAPDDAAALVARVPGQATRPAGATVTLRVDMAGCYLFSADGTALARREASREDHTAGA